VRPTRQATGTEEFCELFLTDVRVPAAHLIGEENAGWRMAQTTLATERAFNILELQARLAVALGEIAAQALVTPVAPGRMAADDDGVRQDLAARAAEIEVLGLLGQRLARDVERTGEVGPEGSIVKLFYSETLQKLTALAVRISGPAAMLDERREFATSWTSGHWMIDHLKSWNWTIAAGSNEIQRNIIGERVLGLPREPQS
jgi:alkylation response protein AidB-like acyl-CoA dehydrogenase